MKRVITYGTFDLLPKKEVIKIKKENIKVYEMGG